MPTLNDADQQALQKKLDMLFRITQKENPAFNDMPMVSSLLKKICSLKNPLSVLKAFDELSNTSSPELSMLIFKTFVNNEINDDSYTTMGIEEKEKLKSELFEFGNLWANPQNSFLKKILDDTRNYIYQFIPYEKSIIKDLNFSTDKDLYLYLQVRLFKAVHESNYEEFDAILKDYADINLDFQNDQSNTLFSIAYLQREHVIMDIVDTAIEEKDRERKDILAFKEEAEHKKQMNEKILLRLNSKVTMKTKVFQDKSMLHLALHEDIPSSDILFFLLRGADPDAKDKPTIKGKKIEGKKPIDYLVNANNTLINENMRLHYEVLKIGIPAIFNPEHHALLEKVMKDRKGQTSLLFDQLDTNSLMTYSKSLSEFQRGQFLYHLFNIPRYAEEMKKTLSEKQLTEEMAVCINKFGNEIYKSDKEKALKYYTLGAELGNPSGIRLQAFYHTQTKPPDFLKAAQLLEQCAPIWQNKPGGAGHKETVIEQLKQIAQQDSDKEAKKYALNALLHIYDSAFKSMQFYPIILSEIALLKTIEKSGDEYPHEIKEKLYDYITKSWPKALQLCKSEQQKAELLYKLLTPPESALANEIKKQIEEAQLGVTVSACLVTQAAKENDSVYAEYVKLASCFNLDAAKWNYAVLLLRHKPPKYSEAVPLLAQSYLLYTTHKDRLDVINKLKLINKNGTVDAKKLASIELFKIFSTQYQTAQTEANLFDQIELFSSMESLSSDSEINEVKKLLQEQILSSVEIIYNQCKTIDKKSSFVFQLETQSNFELYSKIKEKLAIFYNDPWTVWDLGWRFAKEKKQYDKASESFVHAYLLFTDEDDRAQSIGRLMSVPSLRNPLKKAKDHIINENQRFCKAVIMAISALPPSQGNSTMKTIKLEDGTQKRVPPEIASQWHKAHQFLKNTPDSIESLIHCITQRKSSDAAYNDYYAIFNEKTLNGLIKKCHEMHSNASHYENQSDGILKILEQSMAGNNPALKTRMQTWLTHFGNAETFLKLDSSRHQQLSHRILEYSTLDHCPLANELENKLIERWSADRSRSSKQLLLNFYAKKLEFAKATDNREAIERITPKIASLSKALQKKSLYQQFFHKDSKKTAIPEANSQTSGLEKKK